MQVNEAIRVNKNSAEEYEVVNVQVKDRSAAIFVGCFREKASEAEQLLHTGDRVRICNVTLGKLQSGLSLSTNTSSTIEFLPTTAYSDVSSSFVYLPNDPSSYGQDDYVITGIVATNTYPSCANQKDCQFKRVTLSDNGVLYCEICKSNFADSGVTANGILLRVNLSQKASNICSPEIEKQATVFTPSARMIIGLQEGQYSNYLSITADDIESQLIDKLPIAVKGRLSGQGILGVSQVVNCNKTNAAATLSSNSQKATEKVTMETQSSSATGHSLVKPGSEPMNESEAKDGASPAKKPLMPASALPCFEIGEVVKLNSTGQKATVRYYGKLEGQYGLYLGLELNSADGICDGQFAMKRYFTCAPNFGTFAKIEVVKKVSS